MTITTTAQDIFRTAYENRYTWDSQFPGYRADLTLKQGDEVFQGKILVNADFTVEVTGFEDETVKEIHQHYPTDGTFVCINNYNPLMRHKTIANDYAKNRYTFSFKFKFE
jgi:hypothetical protein